MRRVTAMLATVSLVCGVSLGQDELPSNSEHLKWYDQLIGTWVYEGPALETSTGVVEEGDELVLRMSFKWILEKNAVESNFFGRVKGGIKVTAKNLTGWDTAGGQIVEGGMNSIGGHGMSTVTYDEATKAWTAKFKGVDGNGDEVSGTDVRTLKDEDTLVVQGLDREGGFFQGDGPKYTYKRVKKTKKPKKAK